MNEGGAFDNSWLAEDDNMFDVADMNYLITLANEGANNVRRVVARNESNVDGNLTIEGATSEVLHDEDERHGNEENVKQIDDNLGIRLQD